MSEFKVKFDSVLSAVSEGQKAAQHLGEKAEAQVQQVARVFGHGWEDSNAQLHWQNTHFQNKQTDAHIQDRKAEATAFQNAHDIANDALNAAARVLNI